MTAGWQLITERFKGEIRLIWDVTNVNGTLRAYSISGAVFIVHDYTDGDGWQVYAPVTESGDIEKTLQAIQARAHGIEYDYRERQPQS